MRLFIAINFCAEVKQGLIALQQSQLVSARRANLSTRANLHLTLAFLGECDARQTAAAREVLRAMQFAPFDVTIDCVGRFRREGGDIWWAGVSKTPALLGLQSELAQGLRQAGFALENRRFSPHVTLAREVITEAVPGKITPFGQTVRCVALMKSERIAGRLVYTPIFAKEATI
jgi:2'-5' RNA ligase